MENFINSSNALTNMVDSKEPKDIADYYSRLGVSKDDDYDTIHKAYLKITQFYHPDRNPESHPDNIRKINEAYDTLKNDNKRQVYDLTQIIGGMSFTNDGKNRGVNVGSKSYTFDNNFEIFATLGLGLYGLYEGFFTPIGFTYEFFHDNANIFYFDALAWIPGTIAAATLGLVAGIFGGILLGNIGTAAGYYGSKFATKTVKNLENIVKRSKSEN